jgi:hypothetical protein
LFCAPDGQMLLEMGFKKEKKKMKDYENQRMKLNGRKRSQNLNEPNELNQRQESEKERNEMKSFFLKILSKQHSCL